VDAISNQHIQQRSNQILLLELLLLLLLLLVLMLQGVSEFAVWVSASCACEEAARGDRAAHDQRLVPVHTRTLREGEGIQKNNNKKQTSKCINITIQ